MDDMQPQQTGLPLWAYLAIGVCCVLVVVVVIVVVVRKKEEGRRTCQAGGIGQR